MNKIFLVVIGVILGAAVLPLVAPFIVPALAIVGATFVIWKILNHIGGK